MPAQDPFRKVLLVKLAEPRAYLGLAKLYWVTVNNRSAKAMLDIARQLSPDDPDIHADGVGALREKDRLAEIQE
jgi:hypothetical protein